MGQYEREMIEKHERALEALLCAAGMFEGKLRAMDRAMDEMSEVLNRMIDVLEDATQQEV